jgi:hypothetical protein
MDCSAERRPTGAAQRFSAAGIVAGTLIGFKDEGWIPLVIYPGQSGTTAVEARSIVDLHGAHIGGQVILMLESMNPDRPVVMGILRQQQSSFLLDRPGHVEVDADGERLIVTANEQLVLRCGSASITLTKAGKVIIQGTYVSNRSSGVMRIKGGSVQIN